MDKQQAVLLVWSLRDAVVSLGFRAKTEHGMEADEKAEINKVVDAAREQAEQLIKFVESCNPAPK